MKAIDGSKGSSWRLSPHCFAEHRHTRNVSVQCYYLLPAVERGWDRGFFQPLIRKRLILFVLRHNHRTEASVRRLILDRLEILLHNRLNFLKMPLILPVYISSGKAAIIVHQERNGAFGRRRHTVPGRSGQGCFSFAACLLMQQTAPA